MERPIKHYQMKKMQNSCITDLCFFFLNKDTKKRFRGKVLKGYHQLF